MKISGEALRGARMAKNLTQRVLADSLGVTTAYISMVENGKQDVTWDQLHALAEVVGVKMDVLMPRAGRDVTIDDVREA